MNNLFRKLALVSLAALSLTSCVQSSSVDEDKVYTVKFHHDATESTALHLGSVRFAELVDAATNGKVKITVYANSQLGDDTEAAELIRTGGIEAGVIPTAKLSGFHAPIQVLDLPFLFPNREALYGTLDAQSFKDALFTPMQSKGFQGLNFWESGFKQFTANKTITQPSDFDGLKWRVMDSQLLIKQYEALGAVPSVIAFGETYNALQNGTVDGQENPLVSIKNMKFYEVQTDLILSNHGYLGYALLFSKTFWDSLPAAYRTAITTAAQQAVDYQREQSIATLQPMIDAMVTAKPALKVTTLTPEQIAVFTTAMLPVHEQFRSVIGSDLLDLTYNLVNENK